MSFTSSATFTKDENQTAIGTAAATDADGDTVTYPFLAPMRLPLVSTHPLVCSPLIPHPITKPRVRMQLL